MSLTYFKANDIFVVTYAKSGTTWTQGILYYLYNDTYGDIAHISDVMPIISRPDYGNNGNFENSTLPVHIYKTHAKLSDIPTYCKRIYVMRNPIDVFLSFYSHTNFNSPMPRKLTDFREQFLKVDMIPKDKWIHHLEDAVVFKDDPKVLFISYDDLCNKFDTTLNRMINFLGLEVTDEKRALIKEKTAFNAMKQESSRFAPVKFANTTTFFRKGQTLTYKYEDLEDDLKPIWEWYQRYPQFLRDVGLA